jgi:CRISPR-associated protein Cas1
MLTFPDFKQKQLLIVFGSEGQRLKIQNDNLLVIDSQDELLLQVTCHKILAIWILGNISLTSGLLERSRKYGFSIYLLSNTFKYIGCWNAVSEGNFLLRSKQYSYNSLDIPKYLVKNKLTNQKTLLKSIRKKSDSVKAGISQIDDCLSNVNTCDSIDRLMGFEGVGSKAFFKEWFSDLEWKGRKPRTKCDPLNVILDMGYTYLFNFIESLLLLYGFDVYKGVYHQFFYQRKSLVCDIVEPFRCIIDHKIKVAFGLKQISLEDFELIRNQYFLSFSKAKPYTKFLVEALLNNKSEIFLYIQSYYRQFMKGASLDTYPTFYLKE